MIERLATGARRLDGNDDVLLDALLTDEVGHALGTHAGIEARVSLKGPAGYDACWRLRHDGFVLRHDTCFLELVAFSNELRFPAARYPLSELGRSTRRGARLAVPAGSTAGGWRAGAPRNWRCHRRRSFPLRRLRRPS